jgi:WD40 repeat protein
MKLGSSSTGRFAVSSRFPLQTLMTGAFQVVQVIEFVPCNGITFADGENMASGGNDHTVRLWKLIRNYGVPLRVSISHVMRGHREPVICLAASRTWSIVVSGSKDGSAIVWDLNRGIYVASIWHGDEERHEVHLVAINESTVRLPSGVITDTN